MASLNSCSFIGNVGNIDTRYTAGGSPVTKLSLAVNENWKDKDGNKQEHTEWVRITIFGKLAEIAEQYVSKGQMLYINGKQRTSSYEKEGQKHYSTEVIATTMQMLGGRDKPQASGGPEPASDDFGDSTIPF